MVLGQRLQVSHGSYLRDSDMTSVTQRHISISLIRLVARLGVISGPGHCYITQKVLPCWQFKYTLLTLYNEPQLDWIVYKSHKVWTVTGDIGVICGVDGNLEHLASNSQAL